MIRMMAISVFLMGLFTYNAAFAAVSINEIMYDLEGSDSGREWVEVYNAGSEAVDFSQYKFFESGSNHSLTLVEGDTLVQPGGFAVIVSDLTKFKTDWPGFSGTIFDSSFSLSNTGESLVIKNENLEVTSEYSYSSETGAAGDGNSLQKMESVWSAASPTPGEENYVINSVNNDQNENFNHDSTNNTAIAVEDLTIKTVVEGSGVAFAGIPLELKATSYIKENEPLMYGKYFWNFGDGASLEKRENILDDISHTYELPGQYMLRVEFYKNINSLVPENVFEMEINVLPMEVKVRRMGDENNFYYEVVNGTPKDIDVSHWVLSAGDKYFQFPKNTLILQGRKIILSPKLLGFSYEDLVGLKLTSYQGDIVYQSLKEEKPKSNILPVKDYVQQEKSVNSLPSLTVIDVPMDYELGDNEMYARNDLQAQVTGALVPKDKLSDGGDDEDSESSNLGVVIGLVVLIVLGGGLVYFLRRKGRNVQAGDDFDILDE
jgi:hypothetical protein